MSAAHDCGWWCAVVRLGLAPRWHQRARPISAYSLIQVPCNRSWSAAKSGLHFAPTSAVVLIAQGQTLDGLG